MSLVITQSNETILSPIRENAAVADRFLRKLLPLIRAMHLETLAAVQRQYDATPPELALDEKFRYPEVGAGQAPEGFTGTEHVRRGAWRPVWRGRPLGRVRGTRERAEAALAEFQESLSPSDDMADAVRRMRDRWLEKFDVVA